MKTKIIEHSYYKIVVYQMTTFHFSESDVNCIGDGVHKIFNKQDVGHSMYIDGYGHVWFPNITIKMHFFDCSVSSYSRLGLIEEHNVPDYEYEVNRQSNGYTPTIVCHKATFEFFHPKESVANIYTMIQQFDCEMNKLYKTSVKLSSEHIYENPFITIENMEKDKTIIRFELYPDNCGMGISFLTRKDGINSDDNDDKSKNDLIKYIRATQMRRTVSYRSDIDKIDAEKTISEQNFRRKFNIEDLSSI